jgi:hypothetical protein
VDPAPRVIRVLYRWTIDSSRRGEFMTWWHEGTLRIRAAHRGALGSTLLAPISDPGSMVAVARWQSQEDLEAFWADPGGTPFAGASLQSVELFEEVDDLTL